MSPKKLPKAITRSTVDLPEADAPAEASERHQTRPRRSASKPPAPNEPSAPHAPSPLAMAEEKSASETAPPPIAGELLPPMPMGGTTHAAKRRAVAEKIVERYRLYAALGGLSPLPLVTAAGVTAVILRMVKILSNLYQVPFERDRTRSIIVGLMGGAVPAGLGLATASTLALAIPGVGFVGVAVSSLTAAAATQRIGLVFIERFERGASSAVAEIRN
jgi:uncharacterized protein (DUF697 family)